MFKKLVNLYLGLMLILNLGQPALAAGPIQAGRQATQARQAAAAPASWPPSPPVPYLSEYAIIALNPAGCGLNNGATFGGSMNAYISGGGAFDGGIYSNGCLSGNSSSFDVVVEDGGVYYAGQFSGWENFTPSPQQVPDLIPPGDVIWPDCDDPNAWNGTGDQLEAEIPLAPGLYCVAGNLTFGASDWIVGYDVTIFVDGDLSVNGGTTVNLDAPQLSPDPSPAMPDMLFFVTGDVTVSGSSDQWYEGLIYAPGPAGGYDSGGDCTFYGVGDTGPTLHTQIICWNTELAGTASIDIHMPRSYFANRVVPTLDKTASPVDPLPGEQITYTLAFTNHGYLTATQVILNDLLPAELSAVAVTSTLPITPTGSPYTWELPNLPPGSGGTIFISGQLPAPLPAGYILLNSAAITATAPITPTYPVNGLVTFTVTVRNAPPQADDESYLAI
jgi:uncharacterized repeat protein (TIGR01451 family)